MKWFKHISDSLDDPFIFDLMDRFGADGYLVFFGVLEIYSREFKSKDDWKLIVTRSYLTRKLNKRQSTLIVKCLKHIQNSGKWKIEINDKEVSIFIPKFKELIDDWTKRKLRSGSEDAPKKHNPNKITEEEVDKDINKPDVLPNKTKIKQGSKVLLADEIKTLSKRLYDEKTFPKVHAWVNAMRKKKKNDRAILHTLLQCHLKKTFKTTAWAYCTKIIGVEDGNYNEADYLRDKD